MVRFVSKSINVPRLFFSALRVSKDSADDIKFYLTFFLLAQPKNPSANNLLDRRESFLAQEEVKWGAVLVLTKA